MIVPGGSKTFYFMLTEEVSHEDIDINNLYIFLEQGETFIYYSLNDSSKMKMTTKEENEKKTIEITLDLDPRDTSAFKFYNIPAKDTLKIQLIIINSEGEVTPSRILTERVGEGIFKNVVLEKGV